MNSPANASEVLNQETKAAQPDSALDVPKLKQVTYDAVIVGGGLAGLHAARELHDEGKAFALVESRGQLGGRTVRTQIDPGKVAMGELGAIFVHDLATKAELEQNGAKVLDFPDHAYYVAQGGKIIAVGGDASPLSRGQELIEEAKLETNNISMREFLDKSIVFKRDFTESERKMVAALFEADLGGRLEDVGIACLCFDKQTLGNGTDIFGYCDGGGFSNLTRRIAADIPEHARLFSTDANSITIKSDGTLSLGVALSPDGPIGLERSLSMIGLRPASELNTNALILAIPPMALARISIQHEGANDSAPLIDRVTPDVHRALNMMAGGDVVKIAVRLRGTIVPGEPVSHIAVEPTAESAIPCVSVWGLPAPRYGDAQAADEQMVMMYMGGGQAMRFEKFLRDVGGSKQEVNAAVRRYLSENLGLDGDRLIGDAQVSQWLASAGRLAYTYLKADYQPLNFNPRAAFSKSIVLDAKIMAAGEAFDPLGGSMTTGAWNSGKTAAQSISVSEH